VIGQDVKMVIRNNQGIFQGDQKERVRTLYFQIRPQNPMAPLSQNLKCWEENEKLNGSSEVSESASTSSLGSNSSHSKAPGSQLAHKSLPFNRHLPLGVELNNKLLAIEKDPSLGRLTGSRK
jgi:hypothetical protein